ncbi:kdo(2)-lipid IV(A) palmitoleoyltransferase [Candidatus Steffania adelgidicola]|uniref:kdo(2)-lipid IV(A) palmitoleoyltransferase n=1 Tax=Candidatus Steffania adelgidicola TaxID=1076626 RepID=UPI001D02939C|nr:kdo(2)-lipid IV(A) palmitoleoyltransferase [Candidatus Steffania adelgidicola]UDG79624.1 Lipid A biosynthesis palmitoleoyltransferase [Candidatus Steffania adelgidicola]
MSKPQKFSLSLLHPRYWLTWFGLGILCLLVQLPYRLLLRLGAFLGYMSKPFLKRRLSIARRNLELCFPDMDRVSLEETLKNNFTSLGIGLMETGMAWFWSDARVKRWFNVSGLQHLHAARYHGRGVMIIGIHFMSLELGGRAMGLCQPMMAMYRPHNNKVMELIQTWGRMRSNKAMLDRKDMRGMVNALKQGETVWFAPDQDYGPRGSIFAPFFAVPQAATTRAIYTFVRLAQPNLMPVVLIRKQNGLGYQLLIQPHLSDYPQNDEMIATCYINRIVEREILRAPAQYLWLHRRFKTRPRGELSLYNERLNSKYII